MRRTKTARVVLWGDFIAERTSGLWDNKMATWMKQMVELQNKLHAARKNSNVIFYDDLFCARTSPTMQGESLNLHRTVWHKQVWWRHICQRKQQQKREITSVRFNSITQRWRYCTLPLFLQVFVLILRRCVFCQKLWAQNKLLIIAVTQLPCDFLAWLQVCVLKSYNKSISSNS